MLVESIIKKDKFYHFYQPIYCLKTKEIIGYEALIRSNHFLNPEILFSEAKKEKRLYELDSRSIHKAISTYHLAGLSRKGGKLFVNVFPSTISNPKFPSFLNKIITELEINSQQIIFEITENEIVFDNKNFFKGVTLLKKLGFLVAIDDVGKGYSNFPAVIELNPDYLKLDRYFSKDLHLSKQKQLFIKQLINYCNEFNIVLVLEGLEEQLELDQAKRINVPIAQGFLLGKPAFLGEYIAK